MDGRAVPPFRRIALELRARIEAGELAPGDRLPSTREITRQWGVAMATASKVLAELRREGLASAAPGVGTVVEGRGRPPRPARTPANRRRSVASDAALTSGRIVTAATAIADAEGLAALSMRRVAAELGVATMALYRHVADKDDLVLQMMDKAFAGWPFPAHPPRQWRPRLELAVRMLWGVFRQHPWLAPAMSVTRPQPVASGLPFTEWILGTLTGHGLDLPTAFTAHLTLFNYVRGTAVNVEMEVEAEATSGLDNEQWLATQQSALGELLATGRFPTLARLDETGYLLDLDELFEFGLQRLLDGIAVLVERH